MRRNMPIPRQKARCVTVSAVIAAVISLTTAAIAQTATQPASTQPVMPRLNRPATRPARPLRNIPPNRGLGRPEPVATQSASPPAPVSGANYFCENSLFDWGEVWQGANVTHRFPIKNTGGTTIEILNAKAECHCTVPGNFDRYIEPGQTGFVPFTFRSAGMGQKIEKHAYITLNDPKRPRLTVTLKGVVKTVVKSVPNDVGNFAIVNNPNAEIVREADIVSNVDEPVALELLPSKNQNSPFDIEFSELEAGKKWHVKLKTKPPLPEGSLRAAYRFKTGHNRIPLWTLNVSGFRPKRIAAKPINLRFPEVVASTKPFLVNIENHGKTDFKVLSAEIDDPDLKAEVQPDGKGYKINVTAPVGYKLTKSRKLTVTTDDAEIPKIEVAIYIPKEQGLPPLPAKGAAATQRAGLPPATRRAIPLRQPAARPAVPPGAPATQPASTP